MFKFITVVSVVCKNVRVLFVRINHVILLIVNFDWCCPWTYA